MQPAPLYLDLADAPKSGKAHWVHANDGVRLRVAHWKPRGKAVGTILLAPGRTEVIEKYGRVIRQLTRRKLAVVTIDFRGQGLSDRLQPNRFIGHIGKFTDYQKDVDALRRYTDALDLPGPRFVIAHSMGGCIMLRALIEGLKVEKAVFAGPMWGIHLPPPVRALAWGVSILLGYTPLRGKVAPGTTETAYLEVDPYETNPLTRHEPTHTYMRAQVRKVTDLATGGPSIAWVGEALREMRRLAAMPAPNVPALTFVGTAERIVDPKRIGAKMVQWPGGRMESIQGAKHEIMMEIPSTTQQFYDQTFEFFGV
ncbi:MAG: alpha/beta hydrolase [Planktomarina sp.]